MKNTNVCPGDGYRILETGEELKQGDETSNLGWLGRL